MSSEGVAWAFKQRIPSASAKFVLVALAECAHYKTGRICPSIAHVEEITALNRKTIIGQIDWLADNGFIIDTGDRDGRTKQIKVYNLNLERVPQTVQSQKRNSSDISIKQSQKRDTEPSSEPSSTSVAKATSEESPPIKPIHLLEAYNAMAGRTGLPVAKKLEGERLKKARSLVRTTTVDDLTEAISAIERNPWMHGQNDKGWRADFDFLLQPKSFNRLIEGSYDRAQ